MWGGGGSSGGAADTDALLPVRICNNPAGAHYGGSDAVVIARDVQTQRGYQFGPRLEASEMCADQKRRRRHKHCRHHCHKAMNFT